jgi:sugar/nucleoside kinase (ribokinase family)
MLSDRASFAAPDLASVAVTDAVRDAEWLHLSGYPLFDPATGADLARLSGARPEACRCSVGGGSPAPRRGLAELVAVARPDLLIVDRHEASAILSDSSTAPGSAAELGAGLRSAFGCLAVVTDGAAGATAVTAAGTATVGPEAVPVPSVDATGAGDAFAAALIASLAAGPWPPGQDAVQDALAAAADAGAQAAGVIGAQARLPLEVG